MSPVIKSRFIAIKKINIAYPEQVLKEWLIAKQEKLMAHNQIFLQALELWHTWVVPDNEQKLERWEKFINY